MTHPPSPLKITVGKITADKITADKITADGERMGEGMGDTPDLNPFGMNSTAVPMNA